MTHPGPIEVGKIPSRYVHNIHMSKSQTATPTGNSSLKVIFLKLNIK